MTTAPPTPHADKLQALLENRNLKGRKIFSVDLSVDEGRQFMEQCTESTLEAVP